MGRVHDNDAEENIISCLYNFVKNTRFTSIWAWPMMKQLEGIAKAVVTTRCLYNFIVDSPRYVG